MRQLKTIFVSGGTGYLGAPVLSELVRSGWDVAALTREKSLSALPLGCRPVIGNALDANSYIASVGRPHTFLHMVGVPKPAPWKGKLFRSIDLPAFEASLKAALSAGVEHFVYLSVAHPAPMMRAYIEVRTKCELQLQQSGLNCTILQPWYVLGPGHRWPYALIPAYWLAEKLPGSREGARRLGLVTHAQMTAALLYAVNHPVEGCRILDVPAIRRAGTEGTSTRTSAA